VGLLEPLSREGSGHRRYQAADLERINFLTKLRGTGMTTREGRRYAALRRAGETTIEERRALLQEHREAVGTKLAGTVGNLELIDWKINFYRERLTRT
jgi:DNA-binding transcriptional MerR regulator